MTVVRAFLHSTIRWLVPAMAWTASRTVAAEAVVVNPAIRKQAIAGWAGDEDFFVCSEKSLSLRAHLLDEAVNGPGLTRARFECGAGSSANGFTYWEPFHATTLWVRFPKPWICPACRRASMGSFTETL